MPSEEEINQQQELLAIYRGNVALYLRQQAELGSAHIPPGVANGLREARLHIQRIKQTLSSWSVAFWRQYRLIDALLAQRAADAQVVRRLGGGIRIQWSKGYDR